MLHFNFQVLIRPFKKKNIYDNGPLHRISNDVLALNGLSILEYISFLCSLRFKKKKKINNLTSFDN